MKNISFDNPLWLLIAIPLLAAIIIPYFISVSKDNKTKGWIASLVIHILIVTSVALAAAGMVHTTVMTRTKVYIVADVSYSSNRNLDEIDEYIEKVNDSLPSNSRLGIVCFGNNPVILTSSGTAIKSVKEAVVDDSGTDIAGALDYTATLFSENEIKRIVLITDGFDTTADGSTAAAVERLTAKGIQLDAIYLDNNLRDGEEEIQISDVDYTKATYLDYETKLSVLVESSVDNQAILNLLVKDAESGEYSVIDTATAEIGVGMNIVTFNMPTSVSGVFDYRVELSATADTSSHNNTYYFTQTVAGQRKVLLITGSAADSAELGALYGDSAEITTYILSQYNKKIPYTVEALVKFDEIILSDITSGGIDISDIENINAFIDSVDVVISQYGKSLITIGDLCTRTEENEVFARLEELLPVRFGNANKDAKLYTIVLDVSRSMNDTSQFIIAKDAANKLLSILDDDDYVALVTLAGEAIIEQPYARLGDVRQELYEKIKAFTPVQGTFIGEALNMAYEHIRTRDFEEKQVMLISDGLTFTFESESAVDIAEKMREDNIILSTVNVVNGDGDYLSNLAAVGGGNYYHIQSQEEVADLVFADIADDLIEAVVERETPVHIKNYRDDAVEGIISLPNIYGYMNSKAKLDATMVLSVDYVKNSTKTVEVPLYSYRDHGNGRVATFTSDLTGEWLRSWSGEVKADFFGNVLVTNTPSEHVDYPFTMTVEEKGGVSSLSIIPSSLNPRATAKVTVTRPDGSSATKNMVFDLNRYYTTFDTSDIGRYRVEITYTYGTHSFTSSTYYTVSYGDEYDAFAPYDIVKIYDFMRGVGQISTNGELNLQNDKSQIDTYELSFRVPLLILSVVLFICDVVIRKFKWKDILSLFKKSAKEGAKQ